METNGGAEIVHMCPDSGMPVAPADPDDMHRGDAVGAFRAIVKGGLVAITSRLAAMESAASRKKGRKAAQAPAGRRRVGGRRRGARAGAWQAAWSGLLTV